MAMRHWLRPGAPGAGFGGATSAQGRLSASGSQITRPARAPGAGLDARSAKNSRAPEAGSRPCRASAGRAAQSTCIRKWRKAAARMVGVRGAGPFECCRHARHPAVEAGNRVCLGGNDWRKTMACASTLAMAGEIAGVGAIGGKGRARGRCRRGGILRGGRGTGGGDEGGKVVVGSGGDREGAGVSLSVCAVGPNLRRREGVGRGDGGEAPSSPSCEAERARRRMSNSTSATIVTIRAATIRASPISAASGNSIPARSFMLLLRSRPSLPMAGPFFGASPAGGKEKAPA
jgi:hypothetical protein